MPSTSKVATASDMKLTRNQKRKHDEINHTQQVRHLLGDISYLIYTMLYVRYYIKLRLKYRIELNPLVCILNRNTQ